MTPWFTPSETAKRTSGPSETGILEQMASEGKIQLDDVIVLNPTRHEGFSQLCSTPLYPEWPVAKLSKVKPGIAAALQSALLSVPEGEAALKTSDVDKFVKPLDYGPVEDMMKLLKMRTVPKNVSFATHLGDRDSSIRFSGLGGTRQ